MANEAVLMIETELPISMTCDNATGIEKGTICKITDPFTAVKADGTDDLIAGIAAGEKIASNGDTEIEIYRGGFFKVVISGRITVGDQVGVDGNSLADNLVISNRATAALSGSKILGIAMETGADGETILIELRPHAINSYV